MHAIAEIAATADLTAIGRVISAVQMPLLLLFSAAAGKWLSRASDG